MQSTMLRSPAASSQTVRRISSARPAAAVTCGALPRGLARALIQQRCFQPARAYGGSQWRTRSCNPSYSYAYNSSGRSMLREFMEQMQRQFESAETMGSAEERELPFPVDTTEDSKAYYLYADLPGVEKTDLKITTKDQSVTIRANRPRPFSTSKDASTSTDATTEAAAAPTEAAAEEGAAAAGPTESAAEPQRRRRTERWYGNFRRTLTFPEDADMSKVTAKVTSGVLMLTIQKKEVEQPKWQEVPIM